MSIRDIGQNMHGYVDELVNAVSGKSSDADCQFALERFIQSTFHSLGSLSWYLGADGKVFSDEAVAASQIAGEAYATLNLEREFEAPAHSAAARLERVYSTINHAQQGIAR